MLNTPSAIDENDGHEITVNGQADEVVQVLRARAGRRGVVRFTWR